MSRYYQPDSVIAAVKSLRGMKCTYREIAIATNLTRNQVAGILSRAGLTDPANGMFGTGVKRRPRPKAEAAGKPNEARADLDDTEPAVALAAPGEPAEMAPKRAPEPRACLFIEGEKGRDFAIWAHAPRCAEPVQDGSPYCPDHHALCYHRPGHDGRGKTQDFQFGKAF